MDTELNKQVTKLKIQAKKAEIGFTFETKENLVMIYPNHREDICGSIGYIDKNNVYLVSYIINLQKMRYAADEGFSKEQMQKDKRLNIVKEVRTEVLINHLV